MDNKPNNLATPQPTASPQPKPVANPVRPTAAPKTTQPVSDITAPAGIKPAAPATETTKTAPTPTAPAEKPTPVVTKNIQAKPKKKGKFGKIITIVLVLAALIGGGALAYKTLVIDQKPANILKRALTKDYSDKKQDIEFKINIDIDRITKMAQLSGEAVEKSDIEMLKQFQQKIGTLKLSAYQQKDKQLISSNFSLLDANNSELFALNAIDDNKNEKSYFNTKFDSNLVTELIDKIVATQKAKGELDKNAEKLVKTIKPSIVEFSKKLSGKWYKADIKEAKRAAGTMAQGFSCYNQENVEDLNQKLQEKSNHGGLDFLFDKFKKEDNNDYNGNVFSLEYDGNQIIKVSEKSMKLFEDSKMLKCLEKEANINIMNSYEQLKKTLKSNPEAKKKLAKFKLSGKIFINKNSEIEKMNFNYSYDNLIELKMTLKSSEAPKTITVPKDAADIKELEKDIQDMVIKIMFGGEVPTGLPTELPTGLPTNNLSF